MKKLVILLVLLAAAGTAAWLIYRKTPSGPEDKAVLYGNVDLPGGSGFPHLRTY